MKQHKLYQQLAPLPPKLFERLGLYLLSPLHNVRPDTLALWQALAHLHPHYEHSDEDLFARIFPGKPYNNARLRVLRSYLLEHLENFLQTVELERDPNIQHRLLRRAAKRLDLPPSNSEAWRLPAHHPALRMEDLHEHFLLRQDQLAADLRQDNRSPSHDLAPVITSLDIYYVTNRLKYLCSRADPTLPKPYDIVHDPSLPLILGLYTQLDLGQHPLTAIYYHQLQLFLGQSPATHLQALKELLETHQAHLEPDERINLYTYRWNYLNFKHQAGDPSALRDMFELCKEMIAVEVLFQHGSFTANHFKNIVTIAALLGEHHWAHDFLLSYHHRIPEPWRLGIYAYCRAYLLVEQGLFSEAKRQLMDVTFFDTHYRISYQLLMIKIYYETDDLEGLESVKSALRTYLYRNLEIPAHTKAGASALARFAVRLFHLRGLRSPHKALHRLLQEINSTPQLSARKWLLSKAQSLLTTSP